MRLIKPYFEIWNQPSSLEGVYKQIERVGRVCYKSEDKITEDSAKSFVDRMIKSGHGAMLEHGTVYLTIPGEHDPDEWGRTAPFLNYKGEYTYNKYSKIVYEHYKQEPVGTQADFCTSIPRSRRHITTNFRVLVENGWLDDLQYICEPTEYHEKRVTVHFVCDRGVSHEFVRHRVMSFAQESTRYCNYSKDKFNNELTFIQPCWLDDERLKLYGPYHTVIRDKSPESIFIASLNNAEKDYIDLIDLGWKPQEARAVLPNSLKTELVMTGFISDWKKFFRLRSRIAETGKPHPQAQELADPLMDEFVKRGIMETLL
jgi:thymidylate synthase (FAD)